MKATALVTNACSDAGVVAARSLARAGYRVVGADARRLPGNARSRHLSALELVEATRPGSVARGLGALVERVRADLLLPLGTPFVRAACAESDALAGRTSILLPDAGAFDAAFDKAKCASECVRLGIPAATVLSLGVARERLEAGTGAKLVVKPHVDVGAAIDVRYVADPADLEASVRICQERWGGAVVQEFVEGDADDMRTAVLLFGPDRALSDAFTLKKRRQWPTSGGSTAVGESTAEYALVESVLPFFDAWRWRGPAEVEFKRDARTGRDVVIEINPRLPAYLRFAADCGLDFAARIAALCRGGAPASAFPAYRVGRRCLNPGLFVRAVRSELRSAADRGAVLRGALRDLRSAPALVADMLADPLPALARALAERGAGSVAGGRVRRGPVEAGEDVPSGK